MAGLLVSMKSAKKCCKLCSSEFGHSSNGKAKDQLRRSVKRRERQELRRNF